MPRPRPGPRHAHCESQQRRKKVSTVMRPTELEKRYPHLIYFTGSRWVCCKVRDSQREGCGFDPGGECNSRLS
ncbi:hypothetical protein E2C01_006420 [Portunus trituberculatus]|uniref:Uncharacterized protein n=1 Tax=Portunus trituberculatus TaxID=210409 RepID=A0A5B7CZH8_PORTR|nr:hypothetical protein [Portunus trituberculatus]